MEGLGKAICITSPMNGYTVSLETEWLACPRCRNKVVNVGFGLVSCPECDSIMNRESTIIVKEFVC